MDSRPLCAGNLERFNAAYEQILNAKWEVSGRLIEELIASYDDSASEKLLRVYIHVAAQETKNELARWIGSFCKEKGLLVLVDNLYSQQVGNDKIRAILKKYSLLEDINLEPEECETIISVLLDFLVSPAPDVSTWNEQAKFESEMRKRTSAARIVVVLNGYASTSEESRARIQDKGDLIVNYHLWDHSVELYQPVTLNDYLSGHIR